MAATLKDSFGTDVELIGGGGGIFDVVVDGSMIFSKQQEGNEFPEHAEIAKRLEEHQSDSA